MFNALQRTFFGNKSSFSLRRLSNFFARKGIVFDMETGLFRIENEYAYKIKLVGHGQRYSMLRKALQRNGFLANRDVESDTYIETGSLKDENGKFIIHFPNETPIEVTTIEELLTIILKLNNNEN